MADNSSYINFYREMVGWIRDHPGGILFTTGQTTDATDVNGHLVPAGHSSVAHLTLTGLIYRIRELLLPEVLTSSVTSAIVGAVARRMATRTPLTWGTALTYIKQHGGEHYLMRILNNAAEVETRRGHIHHLLRHRKPSTTKGKILKKSYPHAAPVASPGWIGANQAMPTTAVEEILFDMTTPPLEEEEG